MLTPSDPDFEKDYPTQCNRDPAESVKPAVLYFNNSVYEYIEGVLANTIQSIGHHCNMHIFTTEENVRYILYANPNAPDI